MAPSTDAESLGDAPPPSPRGRSRPPLPAAERRGLRRTGALAGGLVGVGVAVTPPTLAFAVFGFAAASVGWGDALGSPATWIAAGIAAIGIGLLAAGWLLSLTRLRHWAPRARRLTASAFAITAAAALLLDALLVVAFVVLERSGVSPTEWLLVSVGALLAIGVGGAVGMLAWPGMAHLLRPAHPPLRP
jgi:hypothetical protein